MGIQNFPTALQPIIQQNWLEQQFEQAIKATLGFRSIADRELIPNKIGETVTKTRAGLLPVDTTPLTPSNVNTNFDNGLTAQNWGVEQFTLTMHPYGKTMDLNTVQEGVGMARRFVQNAYALGEQAIRTIETLARDALFAAYLGGNTRVTQTLGAPGTTVHVDDIRGFLMTWAANGTPVAVSPSNPVNVVIGADTYSVTGATADGSNVSTAPNGVSGTLTTATNCTVADGTLNNAVVLANAPTVLRPHASGVMRATTAALVAGDTMQFINQIMGAAALMRDNGVPSIDGYYHWYGDNQTILGLFKDPEFQLLFRGEYGAREWQQGTMFQLGGVKFLPNNMAPQQTLGALKIRRSIICGQGALIEGQFQGQNDQDTEDSLHTKFEIDGVTMITREPMDRFAEIIAQSWKWIGDYTVPTDITTTSATVPTANSSAYKRAIVLESL